MKEKWNVRTKERIFKNTYSSGKCEDQKENSSFHNEGGNRRRARS